VEFVGITISWDINLRLLDPTFFFFEAEDGIRVDLVTVVQTCALPIYDEPHLEVLRHLQRRILLREDVQHAAAHGGEDLGMGEDRSEERRVGIEGINMLATC